MVLFNCIRCKSDSTELLNTDFSNPVRKIEVANSKESTQIALQFNKAIESFEIMPPLKKGVSLILRFPQEDIKMTWPIKMIWKNLQNLMNLLRAIKLKIF